MKLYKQTKRFLLLLVILSAVTFADAQNGTKAYQVNGIVPEGVDKIYIYKSIGLGQREMIDSVAVSNRCFTMSGPRPAYDLLSIGSGAMGIQFFNDGEPLRIDFVRDSLSASQLNERFYRYCKEGTRFTDEFYRLFIAMKQAGDETRKREFERQMAANDEASHEFERNIIHDNRDNVIAAYYLNELCSFMDFDELSECLDSTVSYYNHPLLNEAKTRLQILRGRQIGKPFCDDVTLLSPDGKQRRLSEWCGKGKHVFIDFWASWCRPCRMEIPNVIQNYEHFHNKGFEVLAISIDDKKEAWKRGIKDFGTPFIQLSEQQGRKSRLCAIYGINTIPANLLIDPQGKIIAADLRGKSLTRKLKSIFK